MSQSLDNFRIISDNQYRFFSGRGTQPLLEEFTDELHYAFEKNEFTFSFFVDVSKAFESVSHANL